MLSLLDPLTAAQALYPTRENDLESLRFPPALSHYATSGNYSLLALRTLEAAERRAIAAIPRALGGIHELCNRIEDHHCRN